MMRFLIPFFIAAPLFAGELEIRRGVENALIGSDLQVADVTLASGFAKSNGGAFNQLAIGRDGGRRTLIRFDLTPLSGKIGKVQEAVLKFHPIVRPNQEEVEIAVYEVSPANSRWSEGSGEFKGEAKAGESTWAYRTYPSEAWSGGNGVTRGGADFEGEPLATFFFKSGPVEIALKPELIERWMKGENSGLLLVALNSEGVQERTLLAHSSEAESTDKRPSLWIRYQ